MLHAWATALLQPCSARGQFCNNTIQYISPTVSGFKANVIYGFGEVPGDSGHNLNITVDSVGGPVAAKESLQRSRNSCRF